MYFGEKKDRERIAQEQAVAPTEETPAPAPKKTRKKKEPAE